MPRDCLHHVVALHTGGSRLPNAFNACCCACDVMLEALPLRSYVPAGPVGALWFHVDAWRAVGVDEDRARKIVAMACAQEWR